jgi:hypothetical protein
MALVTKIDQNPQIHNSDSYDDTVAPTEAAFETNPVHLETDLNNIRSMLSHLLDVQAGDWFDVINTPSALETGTQRGVNDLNTGLHALEKKRVLRCVWGLNSISIALAGDTFDILGTGELPGNTTAAVGAVTTLGTIVAAHGGTFGTHALSEVAGTTAINPKNLVEIVDGATRDPVLDAGDKIYGLLQGESGVTDGVTITDTTTTRVQISFVKINGSGNDLIAITSGAMDGVSYDYCYVERVRLEDLNEEDFLGGASVDVPAGSTVTRQVGYTNQGATIVTTAANATLDLGTGLTWEIGDDDSAALLTITEASAGSASTVALGAQVDTFDVDAGVNDFLNGISIGTTGTDINVAVTAGQIDRAADLTLFASGSGELFLHDSNISGEGTWAQAGVKLTETAAEVTTYESNFGGEVSLFNAINQAYAAGADPLFTRTVLGANVLADTDVGGPGTAANNLDVDLPDAMTSGTFTLNHALYYNGSLLRPGANAAANQDYYPGTTFTAGDVEIMFEDNVKSGAQITVWTWP